MPKHRVVIFLPHTAREETSDDPTTLLHYQNAVLDPDLSKVKGLFPPHFWKLDGAEVVPMNEQEMQERILMIDESIKKGVVLSNVPEKKTISEVINSIDQFNKKAEALRELEEQKRKESVAAIKKARMMREGLRKAAEDALKADMKYYADCAANGESARTLCLARDFTVAAITMNNRAWRKATIILSACFILAVLAVAFLK